MSVKLQMQLEYLEQKIGILTARLNQGDQWKRHLEFWLLDQLGMKFPEHLSMSDKSKPSQGNVETISVDNTKFGATLKENDENQCSNVTKAKRSLSLTPDLKFIQNKRRISSGINYVVPVTTTTNDQDTTGIVIKEAVSQNQSENNLKSSTTTTRQTSVEIVHSPATEMEIDVKYEPLEVFQQNQVPDETSSLSSESKIYKQLCEKEKEKRRVRPKLKIDAETLDDQESADVNNKLPDNNKSSTVFSGATAEDSTKAKGISNPDGTATLGRPNNNPDGKASSSTTMMTAVTPGNDTVDPKGTFECSICQNKFQGLYLFRQHEKKSGCRRLARMAKLKQFKTNETTGSCTQNKSQLSPFAVPDPLPILKFSCDICKSNYASSAYLKFHLSKVHNVSYDNLYNSD